MGPIVAIPARTFRLLKLMARCRRPLDRALTAFHVRNIIREANGVPLKEPQCRHRRAPCEYIRRSL
jgi:hypothetical protein